MSKITVNIIELASNLAHDRTLYESGDICDNEDEMWENINANELVYKDKVQERFNAWYDHYLNEIDKCIINE